MRTDLLKYAFGAQRRADSILSIPELDSKRGLRAGEVKSDRLSFLQGAITGTPYDDWMMFTDDSHWEPSVDYSGLAPHLGTICTRGGGPTSWNEDAYNDSPDAYWFDKAGKIRATGLSLGSYWVANFGLMIMDFKNPKPLIDAMKTAWYGKFIPDWIALDFEVATFYRGSTLITIPNQNLVTGLSYLLEAMWEEWRKTVFLYSRVTFMQEHGKVADGTDGIRNVVDTKNKGETRFPLWLAYYPTSAYVTKKISPDPSTSKLLLPPKTETNRKYLEYGLTKPAHIAWQYSPKLTWNGVPLDWSIFPMTKGQWNEWIGFTPPTPEPEPEPEPSGEYVTKEVFNAFASQYAAHTHETGVAK